MEKFIPARPGIDIGCGFNVLNGEARGVSVGGSVTEGTTSGQINRTNTKVVESQEQMNEALSVSVEASGHYGLFSAEGRFGLSQQSSFTSQSTYVVAQSVMENAFRSFERPTLLPEADKRLREDGPESFKEGYGHGFVKGMRTGGEFYAVFQLTSSSSSEQSKVAVSLQAEVQGLLAGGSLSTSVENIKKCTSQVSSMSVVFYQRAGSGETISPVTTPEEIAKRLKDFPAIVKAAPVGYMIQVIDYQVLALPKFDELGFQQRAEALEDYARLKMKFSGIRAEIDLVQRNPDLFIGDYKSSDLTKSYDLYTNTINFLNKHARRVANKEIEPSLFIASAYDPSLAELPIYVFKKKAPSTDIVTIPDVRNQTPEAAASVLTALGLNPRSTPQAVTASQGLPINVVTKQTPGHGESATKGTTVAIEYNYVPTSKYPWLTTKPTKETLDKPFKLIR